MSQDISDISWDTYEKLLDTFEEYRAARLTYDQGVLELMVRFPGYLRKSSTDFWSSARTRGNPGRTSPANLGHGQTKVTETTVWRVIVTLRQQLAELRFFASIIGSAVTRRGQFSSAATVESRLPSEIGTSPSEDYATWQQEAEVQVALITDLRHCRGAIAGSDW